MTEQEREALVDRALINRPNQTDSDRQLAALEAGFVLAAHTRLDALAISLGISEPPPPRQPTDAERWAALAKVSRDAMDALYEGARRAAIALPILVFGTDAQKAEVNALLNGGPRYTYTTFPTEQVHRVDSEKSLAEALNQVGIDKIRRHRRP